MRQLSTLSKLLYLTYQEIQETDIKSAFSEITFEPEYKKANVKNREFQSRIRKGTTVIIKTKNELNFGRSTTFPKRNVAEVFLENGLTNLDQVMINRRSEIQQTRSNLQAYVKAIAIPRLTLNKFQRHFYFFEAVQTRSVEEITSNKLNKLQSEALTKSKSPSSVPVGPPGTGKTRTLAACAASAYKDGESVLCLGWTNVAVRRLCEEILKNVPTDDVGLIVSGEYNQYWHEHRYSHMKSNIVKNYERQIICMTTHLSFLARQMIRRISMPGEQTIVRNRALMLFDEAFQLWELNGAMTLAQSRTYDRVGLDWLEIQSSYSLMC